jgi:hypothetical protein
VLELQPTRFTVRYTGEWPRMAYWL